MANMPRFCTYGREKCLKVKLWNFDSAPQQTGDNCKDYIRLVEHLSCTTSIFKSADSILAGAYNELKIIRKTLAQVIAVIGLQVVVVAWPLNRIRLGKFDGF